MQNCFVWDPKATLFTIPWIDLPILWYGLFFALGFWLGALLLTKLFFQFLRSSSPEEFPLLKVEARKLTDRLSLYVVIATVVGARVGHLLFYESPSTYLADPLELFRIRNGGLASHGAILALLLALYLFAKTLRKEKHPITFLRLLDLLAIPAPLAATCIRIGNFFNQEILGTPSTLPWAILFGHPADGSPPIPRHPVQLYEAAGYLALFFLIYALSHTRLLRQEGKTAGLLLLLLFSLRFGLESFKVEQSAFFSSSHFTMGQLLSLPFILLGAGLLCLHALKNPRSASCAKR